MRHLFDNLKTKLRGAFHSWTVRVNSAFLMALPFAEDIIGFIRSTLPEFAGYLPDNWYRATGIVVVILNLLLRMKTSTSLADRVKK